MYVTYWHIGEWQYKSMHTTSGLDGGQQSASRPGRFTPGKTAANATIQDA